jgi:hypothetical protein
MGKRKTGIEKIEGNTIVINDDEAFGKHVDTLTKGDEIKPYEITSASIKEELCNYGYEIKTGPCAGDKIPTRKGSAIVHNDMINAFAALRVHLAIIDEAFKHVFEQLPTFLNLDNHEIIHEYAITGFKIQGNEENVGYVIFGEKWVTTGSIGLETPKITASSSYPFFDELEEAIANARGEVELYMNGKAAPKAEQAELPFAKEDDNAFENPID